MGVLGKLGGNSRSEGNSRLSFKQIVRLGSFGRSPNLIDIKDF